MCFACIRNDYTGVRQVPRYFLLNYRPAQPERARARLFSFVPLYVLPLPPLDSFLKWLADRYLRSRRLRRDISWAPRTKKLLNRDFFHRDAIDISLSLSLSVSLRLSKTREDAISLAIDTRRREFSLVPLVND